MFFYPSDPMAKTAGCHATIAREIAGLIRRKVFKVLKRKDLPKIGNIMRSKMVLSLKEIRTTNEN